MTRIVGGLRPGIWLVSLLVGCSLAGCGGNSNDSDMAAAGGATTQTGNDPDDASDTENCKVHPLSDACPEPAQCPTGPDDVKLTCNTHSQTTRAATECGGTMVHVDYGLGGSAWYFDANGKLVGLGSTSDIVTDCDEILTIYGEVCDTVGETEDLCLATCADQPPLVQDGTVLAETDYDFVGLCSGGGPYQITQAPTACGGNLYTVTRDDGWHERYCFDDAGNLIGSSREDPEGEVAEALGATCIADGRIEPLCDVKPG